MLTKTKLALAAALTIGLSAAIADTASAATRHRGVEPAWQSAPVQLSQRPWSYAPNTSSRFSGPFRTDSAPLTGGGY